MWTMAALSCLGAADSLRSSILKNAIPFQQRIVSPSDNVFSNLRNILVLFEKANSGDPHAQHELGLRYLTGKQFSADTAKAAYWIGKAAKQNLVSARYNFGILLNNGWGIPWNPFEAYKHFQFAAQYGMPEARYVYGLVLTENLVVARNYREAYRWILMSAEAGYAPAKQVLAEFDKRGISALLNAQEERNAAQEGRSDGSSIPATASPNRSSVSADADSAPGQAADYETLLREALRAENAMNESELDSVLASRKYIEKAVSTIRTSAEAGSPEALVLLGCWYETGLGLEKDDLIASVCYLRAVRNQSPWAPMLISKLIRKGDYFDHLKAHTVANDPVAKFVWADLTAFGFDRQLTEAQVLAFLEDAARQKYNEAVFELGLMHYSGKRVTQDQAKGKALLKQAADSGNREAQIRLWMIDLNAGEGTVGTSIVDSLRHAGSEGSVFAQAMLGYCYRKGIGVAPDLPRSVEFYRKAAQRGNKAASIALREMYDEIRPKDLEFRIVE